MADASNAAGAAGAGGADDAGADDADADDADADANADADAEGSADAAGAADAAESAGSRPDGGVLARLHLHPGDITRLEVDAVVTAANERLAGGGGVDGAIHRAAGPELLAACRALGGCPTGQARITPGFRLSARHVIHAVGPVWSGGGKGEAVLLASAYERSLELAARHALRSVAFPCISTGVYGYPLDAACDVAVRAVAASLAQHAALEVLFCTFGDEATRAVGAALAELATGGSSRRPPA